jgi:hypothetical protein
MPRLGTLVTYTTYGTWLCGDARGWVDHGQLLPAEPLRELADYDLLKHPPMFLPKDQLLDLGGSICESLHQRLGLRLLAFTVQIWHVHYVVPATAVNLRTS